MDYANKKLENGLESIYDRVRRPFKRLYIKLAVTQNTGQSRFICCDVLQELITNKYITSPGFLNGTVINYVNSSVKKLTFTCVDNFRLIRENLLDNELTRLMHTEFSRMEKASTSDILENNRQKMLSSWSHVDTEFYDKYKHSPILNKLGDSFIFDCILGWSHTDLLMFEDFMRSRFGFNNIKDFFLDELECISSLIASIEEKLDNQSPSLTIGAMTELLKTLSDIKKRLS